MAQGRLRKPTQQAPPAQPDRTKKVETMARLIYAMHSANDPRFAIGEQTALKLSISQARFFVDNYDTAFFDVEDNLEPLQYEPLELQNSDPVYNEPEDEDPMGLDEFDVRIPPNPQYSDGRDPNLALINGE